MQLSSEGQKQESVQEAEADTKTDEKAAQKPRFLTFDMSALTPVVISNTNNGRNIFCGTIGSACGTDDLPAWVEDCVLLVRFLRVISLLYLALDRVYTIAGKRTSTVSMSNHKKEKNFVLFLSGS